MTRKPVPGILTQRAAQALTLALAAAVALAAPAAQAQSGPPGGMPPGGMPPGGMPRPPKPPKPLKVEVLLEAVDEQFRAGDRDRDGFLTVTEVREQIREAATRAVRRRFAAIDLDRNGALDFGEFQQWQEQMGSQALSDVAAASIRGEMVPSALPLDLGSGDNAMILRLLIEPLGATVVLQADADSDGRVDPAELRQYQRRRFDQFDANKDDALDMMELPRPGPGKGPGGGMPMPPPPSGMPMPERPG
ncbi:hypothetical protein ACLBKU_03370 [Erythrobacter sp. NE805]|uniref:hypothetical protein n=1 Tax=Erythrobacter sp. NE805 TaxID=3389875 RepID=UPI00396B1FA3